MTLNRGFTYAEKLDSKASGLTVIQYLSRRYPHSSEGAWRMRIDGGLVRLDGAPTEPSRMLRAGQTLAWHRPPWREPAAPTSFAVLYEDPHLLAVAKPRGLPTMPGGGYLSSTLLHIVGRHYPNTTPLHRLGRATSGVALFARSARARSSLTRAWQRREVLRIYRTLVEGSPRTDEMEITAPVGPVPHPLLGTVHAVSDRGKPARSKMVVLERREDCSLVQVELVTGRPHQIRIHLAYAGLPLVGDPLYPPGGIPTGDSSALPGDPGYELHAERLGFFHPQSGDPIIIECIPPPRLRRRSPSETDGDSPHD